MKSIPGIQRWAEWREMRDAIVFKMYLFIDVE